MSILSGINPLSAMLTAGLGPIGGPAAQLALRVVSQVGQEFISQLGHQNGYTQGQIDEARGEFAQRVGDNSRHPSSVDDSISDFGKATNMSPQEIGNQQRQVHDFINQTIRNARESDENNGARGGRAAKGEGWLMAIAKALGEQLDSLGDKMEDMASRITKDTPGLSAQFGVVTQQFSMLMNATMNAVKTLGEALGKAADKH